MAPVTPSPERSDAAIALLATPPLRFGSASFAAPLLQADVDRMASNLADKFADARLGGRPGIFQHHSRVLRQERALLLQRDGESGVAVPAG